MAEDFEFNEGVASIFDDMLLRSIPHYAEIQRMNVELAQRFAQPGSVVVDLGCSLGTTLISIARGIKDPSVRFLGVDNSQPMLERARRNLEEAGIAERCELRAADLNDEIDLGNASVVTMNWTLQFVRPLNRDRVIRRIHDGLNDHGCLIVFEKVLGDESLLNRMYIDLYYDFKRRNGYSDLEIAEKRERLENVLIPYRIDDNLQLLKRNGFAVHDVVFRWYNWAGFLAVKMETRQ
ncbi:MAG TPA: carboxy-S-adenosyl-L-methionine synthase CmoA [Burkholderiales bacterium]|nr:carboxy-S-adenosyl-L-methionine synthase CmoA [Burkholderiales bacterium]HTS85871.1 carboxy-S-adenosyl-L-methionine synthase CmoA [Usitatibacter sp.]